jgi:hypothetical protein
LELRVGSHRGRFDRWRDCGSAFALRTSVVSGTGRSRGELVLSHSSAMKPHPTDADLSFPPRSAKARDRGPRSSIWKLRKGSSPCCSCIAPELYPFC